MRDLPADTPSRVFVHAHAGGRFLPVGVIERTGRPWPPVRRGLRFRYGKRWLEGRDGPSFEIDPVNLPFGSGWMPAPAETEIHGAFRDAGPDAWGQGLMARRYAEREIGMLEMLILSGGDGAGLLGFSLETDALPPPPIEEGIALEELLRLAEVAQDGDAPILEIARLLDHGSPPGGARPKAQLRYRGALWVAKFPHREDRFDVQRVEAACLDMAAAIGIDTPERELVEIPGAGGAPRSVLLVRRFDRRERDGYAEHLAYLSAETVLGRTGGPYRSSLAYRDLLAIATRLGHAAIGKDGAGPEIFRRLLLNVAVHNTDDHLRNHAFIRDDEKWRLSPVFDVVPQSAGETQMTLGLKTSRAATLSEAMAAADTLALTRDEADAIAGTALPVLARWRAFMAARGIRRADLAVLEGRFGEIDRWAATR